MIFLYVSYCVVAGCAIPAEEMLPNPYPTEQACLVSALPDAAKWFIEHEDYELRGMRCGKKVVGA